MKTKPQTLTPADVARILTRRLGRPVSTRAVYRRLNQALPIPGAIAHGHGRRRSWTIPNTQSALEACTPSPRGRPPKPNP